MKFFNFRIAWDIIISVFVLYSTFLSPIDIAFEFSGTSLVAYKIGDYVTLVFFSLDIFINCRTTFFTDNNDEIINGKIIARAYLGSTMFIFDLISTLPIAEISDAFASGDGS